MDSRLHKYSRRCTFPYLHGVYLAANAIPDVHLLIDAPQCAFNKAEQFFGTHDLVSTLLDSGTRHRVVHTRMHVDNVVDGNKGLFLESFKALVDAPFVDVILLSAFPMAVIIGTPYDNWMSEVPGSDSKLVIQVPGKSLEEDWLVGYSETLKALAARLRLADVKPDPSRVAIVGYLMDRNEEDHRGNVRELTRLLGRLGLTLVSTWLSGEDTRTLGRAAEAGTLLAFPRGREAARILAKRTGATVVDCDIPFGMEGTSAWLRRVGEACGRTSEAERIIAEEVAEIAPRMKWLILKRLVNARLAFLGDPDLIPGFCGIARYIGASVPLLGAWCLRPPAWPEGFEPPVEVRVNDSTGALTERFAAMQDDIDLVIGNSRLTVDCCLPHDIGFMEFGFPSLRYHAVFDSPFLGYRGFSCFVNRIANQFQDLDIREDMVDW